MTRFCASCQRCLLLVATACSFFVSIRANAVITSWNTNASGDFTTAANWDNGVPGSSDTAVFNRGAGVTYTVTFPGGNYPINYLRVHSNNVTFADDGSPSTLSVVNPDVSIVVGQDAGELAILTTSLSSLSGAKASIGRAPGADGTLNVSAGTLSLSSTLDVGDSGTGAMNVTSGGNVSNTGFGYIAHFAGSTGTATVSGAGSTWTNSDWLSVGNEGAGTLMIEAGGSVSDTVGFIGASSGSTGTAIVTGAGSIWTNSTEFQVGSRGAGTLRIESGGSVVSSDDAYIGTFLFSTGTATVTGVGSSWTNNTILVVGDDGAGTLTIENGGSVSDIDGYLGYELGSTGTVAVTGAGSTWTNSDDLYVGQAGTGTLTIEAGGSVSNDLGNIGATGTATVTGAGSTWTSTNLVSGGILTIEAGGSVSSQSGSIFGTATVTGAGSTWTGSVGVSGSLTIEAGGSVSGQTGVIVNNGTATVTGVGSTWTNSSSLTVNGSLTIDEGGAVSNILSFIGSGVGTTGTVTVTGATWNNSGSMYVGGTQSAAGGVGTLTVNTGATINIGQDLVLWSIGTLTVNTGATINIGQDLLWSMGTVNLYGGQINLGDELISSGGAFNFSHGTLHFSTSQAIGFGSPIERALGGERRMHGGQHLIIDGALTLDAPFQIDGGHLEVDSLVVNSELLFTAGLLEVRGGSLTGLTSLAVPANGEFRTSGVHSFRVTGLAGSTITATGNLTLGDATKVNGFYTSGTVDVGANTVTLADANDVVFDSGALATLGSGASPGTLSAANGLTLDFGGNITGIGTVSTPNLITKPLINNGHITGNSAAERITLPGYVKGVGTFDNVNLTGTFSPGLSPTTITVGNLAFAPTSTLIIEIGGLAPGSEHDQIISSGQLAFDGNMQVTLIDSFSPSSGQSFNIFDWATTSGTFDNLTLPALSAGLNWDTSQLYTAGVLSVVPGLPGDYNFDGTVDAADYVVWRKNPQGNFTQSDYNTWYDNFGETLGGGSSPPLHSAAGNSPELQSTVPEPDSLVLLLLAAAGWYLRRR